MMLAVAASPAVADVAAGALAAVGAAEARGEVGERFDGFLGFAVSASNALRHDVAGLNIRRRALYNDLAARRGVSPAEVGITAGCSLIPRTAVGEAYLLNDNVWRRRASGQSAPRPDYCR